MPLITFSIENLNRQNVTHEICQLKTLSISVAFHTLLRFKIISESSTVNIITFGTSVICFLCQKKSVRTEKKFFTDMNCKEYWRVSIQKWKIFSLNGQYNAQQTFKNIFEINECYSTTIAQHFETILIYRIGSKLARVKKTNEK